MVDALKISGLTASAGHRQILHGLDLAVPFGELHALMGPNGSGKSTLCHVLSGKVGYEVEGSVLLDGVELLGLPVDERARLGLFQAFQYPVEVPGVSLAAFLDEVAEELGWGDLSERVGPAAQALDLEAFLGRSLNDDLSGGEKKRSEILQLEVLRPKVAILDEIDSGLDIDAVRQVAAAVEAARGPDRAVIMITHYARILQYIKPDLVHVIIDGRIVQSGGPELADELESTGYEKLRERFGLVKAVADKKASEFFTDLPF